MGAPVHAGCAARLAIAAAIAWQGLAAGAIVLRPELDPSWQPPSEWAIGRLGWIMSAAFFCYGLSYVALLAALWGHVRGMLGRVGLVLLAVCALGAFGVGMFTADPISVPFDALSTRGTLHVVAGSVALILLPLAALCINLHLARANPAWAPARAALTWSAPAPLLTFVGFAIAMAAIEPADHHVGPDVPIGWPSRLLLLSYSAWLIVVAWQAKRIGEQISHS